MKIEEVKKLDNGVSGITIEGKIIKTPKPPGDSEYGWSQMIILKDDTGEMGSWINIENAENAYKVGQYIKVQGKVSKYMKGGKPGISLNNGKVIEEITQVEKVLQEQPTNKTVDKPVERTVEKEYTNSDYWHDKTLREIENNKCIVRECAIKAVSEEAVINLFNILDEKQYFGIADKIVDYIKYDIRKVKEKITSEAITKEFGGTKEEKIDKAKEIVGKTEFRPVTVEQQKVVYGYEDEEGKWHKGIIESRYITKEEIRDIGDPKNLSVEKAGDKISWWWGKKYDTYEKEGERKRREREHPRNEDGTLVGDLTKGNKTSLTKDVLVDDINAWRRENLMVSNKKFKDELGYNGKLETLSEEDLLKIKKLIKNYHPKDWDK